MPPDVVIFYATPLAMTDEFFFRTAGWGEMGIAADYTPRQTIRVEAPSPERARNKVWEIYQNLDDDHLTPDNGRSLMVGDLVEIAHPAEGGNVVFRVMPVGWEVVTFPA